RIIDIAAELEQLDVQFSPYRVTPSRSSALPMALLKPYEQFCLYAMQRNGSLVDNLLGKMKKETAATAILVAGGFHTDGITQFLRQKDVSYVVVTPKVTEAPKENRSLDVFARDPLPLEKMFAGEAIYLVSWRLLAENALQVSGSAIRTEALQAFYGSLQALLHELENRQARPEDQKKFEDLAEAFASIEDFEISREPLRIGGATGLVLRKDGVKYVVVAAAPAKYAAAKESLFAEKGLKAENNLAEGEFPIKGALVKFGVYRSDDFTAADAGRWVKASLTRLDRSLAVLFGRAEAEDEAAGSMELTLQATHGLLEGWQKATGVFGPIKRFLAKHRLWGISIIEELGIKPSEARPPTNAGDLLREVHEFFKRYSPRDFSRFVFSIEEGLLIPGEIDRDSLFTVLGELMTNAADEQKSGVIQVRLERAGDEIVFRLTNQGTVAWGALRGKARAAAREGRLFRLPGGTMAIGLQEGDVQDSPDGAIVAAAPVSVEELERLPDEELLYILRLSRGKSDLELGGQGGGLNIVRDRVVSQWGGKLHVETIEEAGVGSVTVSVALKSAEAERKPGWAASLFQSRVPAVLAGMSVYLLQSVVGMDYTYLIPLAIIMAGWVGVGQYRFAAAHKNVTAAQFAVRLSATFLFNIAALLPIALIPLAGTTSVLGSLAAVSGLLSANVIHTAWTAGVKGMELLGILPEGAFAMTVKPGEAEPEGKAGVAPAVPMRVTLESTRERVLRMVRPPYGKRSGVMENLKGQLIESHIRRVFFEFDHHRRLLENERMKKEAGQENDYEALWKAYRRFRSEFRSFFVSPEDPYLDNFDDSQFIFFDDLFRDTPLMDYAPRPDLILADVVGRENGETTVRLRINDIKYSAWNDQTGDAEVTGRNIDPDYPLPINFRSVVESAQGVRKIHFDLRELSETAGGREFLRKVQNKNRHIVDAAGLQAYLDVLSSRANQQAIVYFDVIRNRLVAAGLVKKDETLKVVFEKGKVVTIRAPPPDTGDAFIDKEGVPFEKKDLLEKREKVLIRLLRERFNQDLMEYLKLFNKSPGEAERSTARFFVD
ncbi:MAG: ATP-binding protein, partial [Elusimicrobia bacterium]|nr:ATP-binding protein [Elusimicrobiota bacterium]